VYRPKEKGLDILSDQILELKKSGIFPKKWDNANSFAYFIAGINAMLLFADHTFISELMGKRLDEKRKPTKQSIITIDAAKKFMDSEQFKKARIKIMHEGFGEMTKNNSSIAMLALQRKILAGDNEMIKVALEMDGLWTRGLKVTRVDDKRKNKEIAKMMKEIFTHEHVEKLDGNN